MIEGVPEKCLDCPILKIQLGRLEHQEQAEADMIMDLVTEDQDMAPVLATVRHIPFLRDQVEQWSDQEILRKVRESGSIVVEMTQKETERLRRELGALTLTCNNGPLKLRASRGAIEYTATICASPLHLEENDGPTDEVVTVDRKDLD